MKIKLHKSGPRAKGPDKITSIRFPLAVAQKLELLGKKASVRSATDTINQILEQYVSQVHPRALSASELKQLDWAAHADKSSRKDYTAKVAKVAKAKSGKTGGKKSVKAKAKKAAAAEPTPKLNPTSKRLAKIHAAVAKNTAKPERRKEDKAVKKAVKAVKKAKADIDTAAGALAEAGAAAVLEQAEKSGEGHEIEKGGTTNSEAPALQ